MKKNIAIIYGGKSVEHEVSIITGLQVYENINLEKYNPILIYIDKDGNWFKGELLKNISIYTEWERYKKKLKKIIPSIDRNYKNNIFKNIDAVIIACHGTYGEDGKLQGFLDLLEIPYTSCGVVASSSGMDKIVMKNIFAGIGLPVLPYIWFYKEDWLKEPKECINKIHYTLDYPVFIKPANLGSSIGISMANNENELINAINIAIEYDRRILVEKGVEDAVEINCSCFYANNEVLVSNLEEPIRWEKFLSFEDKYLRSNSKAKAGLAGMTRKIPAEISDEIKKEIEEYSKKIYRTMDCKGVVRIDYLLNKEKTKVYVNEINTIPGSLSFYLWENKGVDFKSLIDLMIVEAIKFNEDKKTYITKFDAHLLEKIRKGTKI